MSETSDNNWWDVPGARLFHGVNYGGSPKGSYEKTMGQFLPERGEIAASIAMQVWPSVYVSEGLVLKPTTPRVVSYTDVGSYVLDGNETRQAKGTMWEAKDVGLKPLLLATYMNRGYNEVFVAGNKTAVQGVYSYEETVDEFTEAAARCIEEGREGTEGHQHVGWAAAGADEYYHRENFFWLKNNTNEKAKEIAERALGTLEGYASHKMLQAGTAQQVIDSMTPDEHKLLFESEFRVQKITEEHKERLQGALRSRKLIE